MTTVTCAPAPSDEEGFQILDRWQHPHGTAEILFDGEDVLLDAPEGFAFELLGWAKAVADDYAAKQGRLAVPVGWCEWDEHDLTREVFVFRLLRQPPL